MRTSARGGWSCQSHGSPGGWRLPCGRPRYRGAVIRDNKLILVFCQRGDAFERAKARARAVLRHGDEWPEYFVQRLAGLGELIADPFLQPETAIVAIEHGRRFVGASVDAGVVADTRRRILTR